MGESHVQKVMLWVADHWPKLIALLGNIGIAGIGIYVSYSSVFHWWIWLILVLSVLFCLAGHVGLWWMEPRLSKLQSKVSYFEDLVGKTKEDYYSLFESQLALLLNDNLNWTTNERISVYRHTGQAFVMLGRYSKNPEYNKRGRSIYPDSEGCIAKAWRNDESVVENLPDPEDIEGYANKLRDDWGINKGVSKKFRMKSRSYVSFALENHRAKKVGVIVFESVEVGVLDRKELKALMENGEQRRIVEFMDIMSYLEPNPTYAKEEGL